MADSPSQQDSTRARRRAAGCVRAFGFVCLLALASGAAAQSEDAGIFEVQAASVELIDGVYFVNARLALELSGDARAALDSGLPLTIRLEIELLNRRPMWVDTEAASVTKLYELEYHALTERYIVRNLTLSEGDQASFASLSAALNFLGRVENLPFIDGALLDRDRGYDVRVRVLLDKEQLPGPLRLLAFWRRDWSLGSEWYRWHLAGD